MPRTQSSTWSRLVIAFLVIIALMLALLDRKGSAATQCRRLATHVFRPGQKLSQKAMLVIREQTPDIRPMSAEEKQLEIVRLQLREAQAIAAQLADRVGELERTQSAMQQILGQLPEYPLNVVPARVLAPSYAGKKIDIGKDKGVREGQFVLYPYISRGRTSGVRDGQAVVTGRGVVGIVAHADTDFSEVRLVTSPDCRLSARIVHWDEPSGKWVAAPEVGRLTGSDDRKSMIMELVRSSVDVAPGDYVVTYSAGIGIADSMILGEVTSVEPAGGGLTHRITVRPRIDFDRLDEVYVLTPRSRGLK